jgi:hypothetical protein
VLYGGEVGLLWIMHIEADMQDSVGDVGVGEHQVLEGSNDAPKVSWISNRRPGLDGDLGLRVHQHQNRLVVHHASSLKNVESKLTLGEEEFVSLILYGDSQEMMEGLEILHGEFPLKGRYGLLLDITSSASPTIKLRLYGRGERVSYAIVQHSPSRVGTACSNSGAVVPAGPVNSSEGGICSTENCMIGGN